MNNFASQPVNLSTSPVACSPPKDARDCPDEQIPCCTKSSCEALKKEGEDLNVGKGELAAEVTVGER